MDSCGNHIHCYSSLALLLMYCPLLNLNLEVDKKLSQNHDVPGKEAREAAQHSRQRYQSPSS